jgi:signal transduction histidine kinase
MNTASLRFRLLFWYAVWLFGVLLTSGVVLYFGIRQYLIHQLSATQAQRAARVGELVKTHVPDLSLVNLPVEIEGRFAPGQRGWFLRVTGPGGKVTYQSKPPMDRAFDPTEIPSLEVPVRSRSVVLSNGGTLLVSSWVSDHGWWVEAGEVLEPALNELQRWLSLLSAGFVAFGILALAGAAWLINCTLAPVGEIARAAGRITSHNLSQRLPLPPQSDEVAQLTQAVNQMIDRLEVAFMLNRRFLADASHELRTPLTILRGELEGALTRASADAGMLDVLGNLLEEVDRLIRLVEGLLTISRLDAGQACQKWERIELSDLAATTASQMNLLAEDKGVSISTNRLQPVWVEGDPARLKQVVVNLLDNAIKYTLPGGSVCLESRRDGNEALLEVWDTGIGIPSGLQAQVFDRFFRVDQARSRDPGGTGIGLSIARAICQAHHGRIDLQSSEGKGSRFTVVLPVASSLSDPLPRTHGV